MPHGLGTNSGLKPYCLRTQITNFGGNYAKAKNSCRPCVNLSSINGSRTARKRRQLGTSLWRSGDEQIWSMDRDSVQTKGSIVSAWVKVEYPNNTGKSLPSGAVSVLPPICLYSLLLWEFDFSDRTYRQVAKHDYGGMMDGKRDSTLSGWEHIIPNTIGEGIYSTLKKWLNW